jgi:hypothetical protein
VVSGRPEDASPLELFVQGRDSYNVVLGGILGAYLGLTISRNGVTQGSYVALGSLLVLSCWFVYCVNLAGDQFHRGEIKDAAKFLLAGLVVAGLSCFAATGVGVDPYVLVTIFGVWIFFILFEIATGFQDVMNNRRLGDE